MENTYAFLTQLVIDKWHAKCAQNLSDRHTLIPSEEAATPEDPPRLLIAVAGAPGSGKSTVAQEVAHRIEARRQEHLNQREKEGKGNVALRDMSPPRSVVVGADGFHLPLSILKALPNAEEAISRRGVYWTFDGVGFVDLVRELRLSAGKETVLAPTFDHAVKDPVAGGQEVDANIQVVILEGLYLLCDVPPWCEIRDLVDERWFVSVDPGLARMRVASRHLAAGIEQTMEGALRRTDGNDVINGIFVAEHSVGRYDLVIESIEDP